jgi:hypothetical protein
MTIYDVGEQTGAWFDLPGGGRLKLRTIAPEDWREIRMATVTKGPPEYVKLDGKYRRFQEEIENKDLQMEMIWDRTILDWEGILDRNGNPIPCAYEWKVRLMLMAVPDFRDFYNEKISALVEAEAGAKAASEKNSQTGLTG